MAVPEVLVAVTGDKFKIRRVTEQLITRRNPNRIICELDTAQSSVPTTTGEIDIPGIPVNLLLNPLRSKVDNIDAAVTLALLGDVAINFGSAGAVMRSLLVVGEKRAPECLLTGRGASRIESTSALTPSKSAGAPAQSWPF